MNASGTAIKNEVIRGGVAVENGTVRKIRENLRELQTWKAQRFRLFLRTIMKS